jgi:hypothetical protein
MESAVYAAASSPLFATAMEEISISNIYLMGGSFVLGSMFTLILLLVLDFVRSKNQTISKE